MDSTILTDISQVREGTFMRKPCFGPFDVWVCLWTCWFWFVPCQLDVEHRVTCTFHSLTFFNLISTGFPFLLFTLRIHSAWTCLWTTYVRTIICPLPNGAVATRFCTVVAHRAFVRTRDLQAVCKLSWSLQTVSVWQILQQGPQHSLHSMRGFH